VHVAAVNGIRTDLYTPSELRAWAVPKKPANYLEFINTKEFFVAEEGRAVIAFGVLNPKTSEVEAVYVSPAAGRRGTGLKILCKLEETARLLGLETLRLNASLNAAPFYEKAGYVAQEPAKYRLQTGVEIACIPMVKALDQAKPGPTS
jgi:N-acetylglutamate synthase-like GNAT family acetyltransferase